MSDLSTKRCESCEGIGSALNSEQIHNLMPQLNKSWEISDDHKAIKRKLSFKNFYETMAFVNALAWIANVENHHPDLEVGYNYCNVSYHTHAVKGLTLNDFICAAKMDSLFQ